MKKMKLTRISVAFAQLRCFKCSALTVILLSLPLWWIKINIFEKSRSWIIYRAFKKLSQNKTTNNAIQVP